VSYETRYYLSDLTLGADEFNKLIRNHWSIENKLHWKLDVVFNEGVQKQNQGMHHKTWRLSAGLPFNLSIKWMTRKVSRTEEKWQVGMIITS
jgi:predicted transposase YbfD/YdcC